MRKILLLIIICCFRSVLLNAQWRTITPAPVATRFDDVTFINSSTGWIAQGFTLWKTTDAGETWNSISTLPALAGNGYVRSIEFINDTIGFYGTLITSNDHAHFFRTTDGGLTWTTINGLLLDFQDGICGIAHSGNTVIAAGAFSSTSPRFYKSSDAGVSWTSQDLSLWATGLVDCYAFDQNNYLVSGVSTNATGNRGIILRTADGGSSWQLAAYCSLTGFSYVWKLFFLSGGTGFASVEGQPVIMKTTDYGQTWTELNLGISSAVELGAIGALNNTVIWAGDQMSNGMYGTTDGGQTWTSYGFFGENMDRMVMLDAQHLLCVGKTIYKFSDGSNTVPVDSSLLSQHHFVTVKPNPFIDELKVHLEIFQSTNVLLDLVDFSGHVVKHLFTGPMEAGNYDKTFSTAGISNGAYTLLFRSNEEFKNITVVRN
jgi:photosystem II stability/assembly factor-like uncharacterized protein